VIGEQEMFISTDGMYIASSKNVTVINMTKVILTLNGSCS
jgi:hypothetical protein